MTSDSARDSANEMASSEELSVVRAANEDKLASTKNDFKISISNNKLIKSKIYISNYKLKKFTISIQITTLERKKISEIE